MSVQICVDLLCEGQYLFHLLAPQVLYAACLYAAMSKCTVIRSFFSDFCDGPKYAFACLFSNAGEVNVNNLNSVYN